MTVRDALEALLAGRSLDEAAAAALFARVLDGEATPAQAAAVLVALRAKGESTDELVGAARMLRARMRAVAGIPAGAVDTCGTGGDGARSFNVSTAAALVVAGAGVPVAKHGNRAVSGAVGSADVLEALGVAIDVAPPRLAACLAETGIAFLYAPGLHPALAALAPVRRELGVRTIFNLLGPLANPASVRRQVVGVPERRWVEPMARALARLGAERAWVVHGECGADELVLDGPSLVARVHDGTVVVETVRPEALGLAPAPLAAFAVDTVAESADRIRRVLEGEHGAGRDVVCLNAAAALVVAEAAPDLRTGLALAEASIDRGRARDVLARLRAFTAAERERAS